MGWSTAATLPRADDVLASHPTISADSVNEAHFTISELFNEHRLSPLDGRTVRMRLRSAHIDGVGIDLLDYGHGVQISPRELQDFYLVQIPLTGRARMRADGVDVQSSPLVATVPPVDRDFVMQWDRDTPHLIVWTQRDRLAQVARTAYGVDDPAALAMAPHMDLVTPAARTFLRCVFEFHDILEHLGEEDSAYVRQLVSELLLARLLEAVDPALQTPVDRPRPSDGHRGDGLYRRFLAVVDQCADTGLGVLGIAELLGVPLRTLQDHVRAAGSTPSIVLREARYRRARDLLAEADPLRTTVTVIAERCGFSHHGHFAAGYRQRFGETPAQTLHR